MIAKTLPTACRTLMFAAFLTPSIVSGFITPANAECTGEDGGSSLVAEIRGGDTLILQDGRSVRLAGVLLPRRGADTTVAGQSREAAEKALADLTAGQTVELRVDAKRRDRYGRVLAQLFVVKDGQRLWIQERLLAAGLARVMSSRDDRLCVADLLGVEKTARQAAQGYWRTGLFSIRSAISEDILSGLAQSYEIVEGRVENVAEVRGRTYLNFGKNWRRDFTVSIGTDAAKLFAVPTDVTGLRGRLVRVRGWIENVNGPSISLTHPEQLEVLESGTAMSR